MEIIALILSVFLFQALLSLLISVDNKDMVRDDKPVLIINWCNKLSLIKQRCHHVKLSMLRVAFNGSLEVIN